MGLTSENVGSKISAKIKGYVLAGAELLINLGYEIPCTGLLQSFHTPKMCHLWTIGLCENNLQYKPNFHWYQTHIF